MRNELPPIAVLRLDPGIPLPTRAHHGDAGVDLCTTADVILEPGERALVGTGLAIALPVGTVGLIHPRSGLAAKAGLSVVNTPGTVDAGYRGEIKVCLINHDPRTPIELRRGGPDRPAAGCSGSSWWISSRSTRSMKPAGARAVTGPAAVTRV